MFAYYEDKNTSYNSEKGAYALIPFICIDESKTLVTGSRKGQFDGMKGKMLFHSF